MQAQESQSLAPLNPNPAAVPSITALADDLSSSSQSSLVQSSQADAVIASSFSTLLSSPLDQGASSSETPFFDGSPSTLPILATSPVVAGPGVQPTVGNDVPSPQTRSNDVAASVATTAAESSETTTPASPDSRAIRSTVAVAAGVIGGVLALSILAFLIWWWRRRVLRKRRSTLLTPLDAPPAPFGTGSREKPTPGGSGGGGGNYVITRDSIGPTPVTERLREAIGLKWKSLRGHWRNKTAPSVDLDRGTSQFLDGGKSANSSSQPNPTAKGRLQGWWSGIKDRGKPGLFPHLRSRSKDGDTGPTMLEKRQKKAALGSKPDFLALLGMTGQELERETQRRRESLSRAAAAANDDDDDGNKESAENPFSDDNAITIAHPSAAPPPLALGSKGPNPPPPAAAAPNGMGRNPFGDENAIRDDSQLPAVNRPRYADPRRRSQSLSGPSASAGVGVGLSRNPSSATNTNRASSRYYAVGAGGSPYYARDSVSSLATTTTTGAAGGRSKFRSDPFDLERPELLRRAAALQAQSQSTTTQNNGSIVEPVPVSPLAEEENSNLDNNDEGIEVRRPEVARVARAAKVESYTSKYSSGVSSVTLTAGRFAEWREPGPDVGPGSGALGNSGWGVEVGRAM